jgi:hypothetical protein
MQQRAAGRVGLNGAVEARPHAASLGAKGTEPTEVGSVRSPPSRWLPTATSVRLSDLRRRAFVEREVTDLARPQFHPVAHVLTNPRLRDGGGCLGVLARLPQAE